MDQAGLRPGTPAKAVVVAFAVMSASAFSPASEKTDYASTRVKGEPAERLLRADMTCFETPAEGAVFCLDSITFCKRVWRGGCLGPLSQKIENVLRGVHEA